MFALTPLSSMSFLLLALWLPGTSVQAQQAEEFGEFEIHYNTLNSLLLTPDVARAYGIQRSGTRALLNIAVLRKVSDGLNEPVTARVSASATNIVGQRRDIELREVRDQDAIYYIGSFRVSNEENMNFRVSVQPAGSPRAHEFSFRQTFYTE